MELDDILKISEANLRKVVPKMGPANKILEARKKFKHPKQAATAAQSADEAEAQSDDEDFPQVGFTPLQLNVLILWVKLFHIIKCSYE
jgi:hypothetical protein